MKPREKIIYSFKPIVTHAIFVVAVTFVVLATLAIQVAA